MEATVDKEEEVFTVVVMVINIFENKVHYVGVCIEYLVRMGNQMLTQQMEWEEDECVGIVRTPCWNRSL